MIMQMFFNGGPTGPNKSDSIDTDTSVAPSPWANLLSMGLKILTAILGGGASNDGIDKVDNGSPMQVRTMNQPQFQISSSSHTQISHD